MKLPLNEIIKGVVAVLTAIEGVLNQVNIFGAREEARKKAERRKEIILSIVYLSVLGGAFFGLYYMGWNDAVFSWIGAALGWVIGLIGVVFSWIGAAIGWVIGLIGVVFSWIGAAIGWAFGLIGIAGAPANV